jgi:hypothetical protein
MALKRIEIIDGRFLWRCTDCGWESQEFKKHERQFPPAHNCKQRDIIMPDPASVPNKKDQE